MLPTTTDHRKGGLGSLAACLLLATACMPPVAAHAAPAAQAASRQSYDIPAGPLAIALNRFSETGNIQLVYDASLTRNLPSPGLRGTMTPAEALSRLLAGSGLSYNFTDGRTVVLARAGSTITLGPVRVGGTVAHQDPTGPGVGYVAENTMAGTKTNTSLMEIPNSIHVVTKQQMQDQQPQNVLEALRYSTGVYSEAFGSFSVGAAMGGSGIKQRGFAASEYVDGLLSTSYAAGETSFLERIEAVNGPASVMYGQNAPGGLITMSLKKPTATPLHEASLGFGNRNRYEATIDVSDKITKSGNVRYRIAAIGNTQDQQTDYVRYQRLAILPSVTWDIDRDTSMTLIGSYNYTPDTGTNPGAQYPQRGTLITDGYRRISRHTFAGLRNFNEQSVRDAMFEYQFQHRFNRYLNFSQTLRWEKSISDDRDSYSNGNVDLSRPNLQYYRPEIRAYSSAGVAFDTRFDGRFDTGPVAHTWVVGSDFRHYDNPQKNVIAASDVIIDLYDPQATHVTPCMDTSPSSGCNVRGYDGTWSYFQEGLYFQDQMKWKRLSVILGGREDWFNSSTSSYSYLTRSRRQTSISQTAFTWRAGLVYQFDFGLAPYFSYATSFTPQTSTDWQGKLFPPLSGKQLEAGMKYKVPGRDILLTAAAYRIDEDHYLISDLTHTGYSDDAGRVRSQGFEVSANANVTKDLRLIASYSFADVRFNKNNLFAHKADPYTGTSGALTAEAGKFVPQIPRNMFSVFADYTIPSTIMKGLGFNWGLRYVGSTYATNVESYKIPSYILFDVGAHYDLGAATPLLRGLKAQLAMSNLTNAYYVTACGNFNCYLGQGRRVYGNLTYNW